jgi:hypothetical protein
MDIITDEYKAKFLDDEIYNGRPYQQLVGLAAVIEVTDKEWRPTITNLVNLITKNKSNNKLLLSGSAFGCAKAIQECFPGPAILLYGAALNSIGSTPNTDLKTSIRKSERIFKELSINEDENIIALVNTAKQRVQFDKVTQMLKDEFSSGMLASSIYTKEEADILSKEIVNITHDVRHRALIDRYHWKSKDPETDGSDIDAGTDTDVGYITRISEIEFTDCGLSELITPAMIGCAFSIKSRLDKCYNEYVSEKTE